MWCDIKKFILDMIRKIKIYLYVITCMLQCFVTTN